MVSPAPPGNTTSYTLNPNADLPAGTCTIKVTATQVTDVDTNNPPDTMVTDFTSTFTSGANNPPSFVVGPNQTVGENAGPQTVSPWATAIDDGDNPPAVDTQALTFNITGNTIPSPVLGRAFGLADRRFDLYPGDQLVSGTASHHPHPVRRRRHPGVPR